MTRKTDCAYGAYGVYAIGAIDSSTRSHCAYGTYGVYGRSMVEVGLPTNRGPSVRIKCLFGPFAFRGACRSHRRFRRPALFTLVHAIDFSTRNPEIYGMYGTYGGNVESMAETDPYSGSSRRSESLGATVKSRRSDTRRSESRPKNGAPCSNWRSPARSNRQASQT
jgi:hypothetical protein